MPRVTQSHRDRQRARVLAAARRCFARRGFHATSMDQIIAEAGMSSSTVYRYFPEGKASLVKAVVDGWADPLRDYLERLSQTSPAQPLEQVLVEGVRHVWALKGLTAEDGVAPQGGAGAAGGSGGEGSLVLEIWGECSRSPGLGAQGAQGYEQIRSTLVSLVRQWQDAGVVTSRVGAAEAAAVIHNLFLGLVAESVIVGEARTEDAARALGRLLAPQE